MLAETLTCLLDESEALAKAHETSDVLRNRMLRTTHEYRKRLSSKACTDEEMAEWIADLYWEHWGQTDSARWSLKARRW